MLESALLGLVLALAVGCRKVGPEHPEVRYASVVTQVELLESGTYQVRLSLDQADRDRRGGMITLRRPYPLDGLAGSRGRAFVARGRDHLAIIGADFRGPDQGDDVRRPGGGRSDGTGVDGRLLWWLGWRPWVGDAIWLADTRGQPIGQVDLRWLEPEGGALSIQAVWDGPGEQLAAWVSCDTRIRVGLVDLELLTFSPVALVDDVGLWPVAVGEPTLLWRNGDLVFCYEAENSQGDAENVVLCIDPSTGEVREVLREVRWDPSRRPMHAVSLSPNGRYVAFDRGWSGRLIDAGGTCAGIWVLDLESGEHSELTYESASRYQHQLVKWEDADSLVFARRVEERSGVPGGTPYDLYRAHLDLPMEEDAPNAHAVGGGGEYRLTATDGPRGTSPATCACAPVGLPPDGRRRRGRSERGTTEPGAGGERECHTSEIPGGARTGGAVVGGALLVYKYRMLTQEQLSRALEEQFRGSAERRRLGEILLEMGMVTEEQLAQVLEHQRLYLRQEGTMVPEGVGAGGAGLG